MKLEIHVNPHPILSLQHEAVTFVNDRIAPTQHYDQYASPRDIAEQVILNFTSSLPNPIHVRPTYNGMVYTCTINP